MRQQVDHQETDSLLSIGLFHAGGVVGGVGEVYSKHYESQKPILERNEKGYRCCDAAGRPESARGDRTITMRKGISVVNMNGKCGR